jgi:hypothetical protein
MAICSLRATMAWDGCFRVTPHARHLTMSSLLLSSTLRRLHWPGTTHPHTYTMPTSSCILVCPLTHNPPSGLCAYSCTRLCGPCCRAGEAEEKIGDLDTSNLVGVERLTSPGEADGQIIMVRDGSKVMAHSWSTAENAWQTIGEVCPRSLLQEMAQTCHISSCVLTVLKSPRAPHCLRAHFL